MIYIVQYFKILKEEKGVLHVEIPSYTFIMIISHILPNQKDEIEKYFKGIDAWTYEFHIKKFYEKTSIDFVKRFREVIPSHMPRPHVPEEFYKYDTIVFHINNALQEFRYSDEEIRRESRKLFGISELPES